MTKVTSYFVESFVCKILNWSRLLDIFFLGIEIKRQTHIDEVTQAHTLGIFILSSCSSRTKVCFGAGEKVTVALDCACKCLCRTLCAHKDSFSFIFLVFGAL